MGVPTSLSSQSLTRGTLASIGVAIFFSGVYYLTPQLAPMSAEAIWATRTLIAVPFLAIVLVVMRQWHLVTDVVQQLRARPRRIFGVAGSSLILAALLWMISWAPLNGKALDVALAFFLFPLLLVVLGRFLYGDDLKWWHWLATASAAVGVAMQVVFAGGISLETLFVTIGYPAYFVLRRWAGIAHVGGMFWEFVIVLPLAIWFVVYELTQTTALTSNPALWWFAPLFSLIAATSLLLYIIASRLLPLSIFGLLTYLEPALLVVASLLIGERIARAEYASYAFIWIAVIIILVGGIHQIRRSYRVSGIP